MAEVAPQFEHIDNEGTTTQFQGTVGTTAIQIPTIGTFDISEILIRCGVDNSPVTKRLQWSLDNVTYHSLAPGEYIGWTLKGIQTQVYIKGSVAGVIYEITMNRESV